MTLKSSMERIVTSRNRNANSFVNADATLLCFEYVPKFKPFSPTSNAFRNQYREYKMKALSICCLENVKQFYGQTNRME